MGYAIAGIMPGKDGMGGGVGLFFEGLTNANPLTACVSVFKSVITPILKPAIEY